MESASAWLYGVSTKDLVKPKPAGGLCPICSGEEVSALPSKFVNLDTMATPGKAARSARPAGESGLLTSRENRWLKEFRMALHGGLPTESGFVGVEGPRLVEEALRSGCPIHAVLFSESGQRHHERLAPLVDRPEMGFPILATTDRLFEGLADTEHPQGVAALVKPRETSFDELVRTPDSACAPLLVVLAGVQDPGNVGTILRTAAAFGATGAATAASGVSGTASPFSPKALRASAGAALHLPILAGMSLAILLTQFKIAGIRTLASSVREVGARSSASPPPGEPTDSRHSSLATGHFPSLVAPWEVDWRQPVALLVGNEGSGLPEEIARSADARIHIPMASGVESLNAAAAAAVVFYEAARQRDNQAHGNR
jgi:TrmH family RNA methyltransferase